jgi:ribosomal protein S19
MATTTKHTIGKIWQNRSLLKLLHVHPKIVTKYFLRADKLEPEDPIYVTNRSSTILPEFEGRKAFIHNGKDFKEVLLKPGSAWHKFGELAFTHKLAKYRKKEKVVGKKNFK